MTITLRFFERDPQDFNHIYTGADHYKEFHGQTARECMKQIADYRLCHDCAKYTATEIYNVED